jgi:hypothetical protein
MFTYYALTRSGVGFQDVCHSNFMLFMSWVVKRNVRSASLYQAHKHAHTQSHKVFGSTNATDARIGVCMGVGRETEMDQIFSGRA